MKGKGTENRVGDTEYPVGLKTIFQINWTESKQHQELSSAQHLACVPFCAFFFLPFLSYDKNKKIVLTQVSLGHCLFLNCVNFTGSGE